MSVNIDTAMAFAMEEAVAKSISDKDDQPTANQPAEKKKGLDKTKFDEEVNCGGQAGLKGFKFSYAEDDQPTANQRAGKKEGFVKTKFDEEVERGAQEMVKGFKFSYAED